jgi:hypothetical protein
MVKIAKKNKLVCGKGHNDAKYFEKVNGKWKKVWACPYYSTWMHMLQRCYSDKVRVRLRTYEGCIVCDEWLKFSNFRLWMRKQQWIVFTDDCDIKRLTLDKDLLSGEKRGKLYSPNTCVFIPASLNNFLIDSRKSRGEYPLGVYFDRKKYMYKARVRNPFTRTNQEHLGSYTRRGLPSLCHPENRICYTSCSTTD